MTSPTWLHITLTALAVSCLIAPGAEPANATPRTITDLLGIQRQVKRILPSAKQATVAILGEGAGTGVIVSPDGLVLTAGHVIGKPGSRLKVILSDGTIVRAKALGTVRFADAGMVRLPKGHYPYVRMATDEVPGMGSWCVALGHPGGPDKKRGPVTRIGRLISQNRHTIRTDCKLIGGDSGGPLLNIRGDIIGIHSRISRAADQNFHVSIHAYVEFWERMLAWEQNDKSPSPKKLGVRLKEHPLGMIITNVADGSPAAKSALAEGDIITHIARKPIQSHQAVAQALHHESQGTLQLRLRRGRQTLAATVNR